MQAPRTAWVTGIRNGRDGRSLTGAGHDLPVDAAHRPPGSTLRATRGRRRLESLPSRLLIVGALSSPRRQNSPLRETREWATETSGRTAATTAASPSTSPRRATATMRSRVAPPSGRIGGAGRRLGAAVPAAAEGQLWTDPMVVGAAVSPRSRHLRRSCWVWLGIRASRSPSGWPRNRSRKSQFGAPTRFRTLSGKQCLFHASVVSIC